MNALQVLTQAAPELELGARYRDVVSGWEGVLTSVHIYMNGCVRCGVEGKDKNGEPKGFTFDQEQVERVVAEPVKTKKAKPSGGPRDSAPVARA